jgi:hypothetical protein
MKIYFDFHDWWIGYYSGDRYHYICPLPTLVIRWKRKYCRACREVGIWGCKDCRREAGL